MDFELIRQVTVKCGGCELLNSECCDKTCSLYELKKKILDAPSAEVDAFFEFWNPTSPRESF